MVWVAVTREILQLPNGGQALLIAVVHDEDRLRVRSIGNLKTLDYEEYFTL